MAADETALASPHSLLGGWTESLSDVGAYTEAHRAMRREAGVGGRVGAHAANTSRNVGGLSGGATTVTGAMTPPLHASGSHSKLPAQQHAGSGSILGLVAPTPSLPSPLSATVLALQSNLLYATACPPAPTGSTSAGTVMSLVGGTQRGPRGGVSGARVTSTVIREEEAGRPTTISPFITGGKETARTASPPRATVATHGSSALNLGKIRSPSALCPPQVQENIAAAVTATMARAAPNRARGEAGGAQGVPSDSPAVASKWGSAAALRSPSVPQHVATVKLRSTTRSPVGQCASPTGHEDAKALSTDTAGSAASGAVRITLCADVDALRVGTMMPAVSPAAASGVRAKHAGTAAIGTGGTTLGTQGSAMDALTTIGGGANSSVSSLPTATYIPGQQPRFVTAFRSSVATASATAGAGVGVAMPVGHADHTLRDARAVAEAGAAHEAAMRHAERMQQRATQRMAALFHDMRTTTAATGRHASDAIRSVLPLAHIAGGYSGRMLILMRVERLLEAAVKFSATSGLAAAGDGAGGSGIPSEGADTGTSSFLVRWRPISTQADAQGAGSGDSGTDAVGDSFWDKWASRRAAQGEPATADNMEEWQHDATAQLLFQYLGRKLPALLRGRPDSAAAGVEDDDAPAQSRMALLNLVTMLPKFGTMDDNDRILELSLASIDADVRRAAAARGIRIPTVSDLERHMRVRLVDLFGGERAVSAGARSAVSGVTGVSEAGDTLGDLRVFGVPMRSGASIDAWASDGNEDSDRGSSSRDSVHSAKRSRRASTLRAGRGGSMQQSASFADMDTTDASDGKAGVETGSSGGGGGRRGRRTSYRVNTSGSLSARSPRSVSPKVGGQGAAVDADEARALDEFIQWWGSPAAHHLRTAHLLRSMVSVVADDDFVDEAWQSAMDDSQLQDKLLQQALRSAAIRRAAKAAGIPLPSTASIREADDINRRVQMEAPKRHHEGARLGRPAEEPSSLLAAAQRLGGRRKRSSLMGGKGADATVASPTSGLRSPPRASKPGRNAWSQRAGGGGAGQEADSASEWSSNESGADADVVAAENEDASNTRRRQRRHKQPTAGCRDADASRPRRGSVASEVKDAVMEAGGAPRASMTTFRTGNTAAGVRASRSRRGGGGRGAREVDGGSESEEGGDTGAASDLELSALIDQALQGSGVASLNPAEYQKMLSRFREWFQSSASSMDPAVRLDFIRRALTAQDASPLDDALRASMEAAGKAFLKRHKQPPPPPSAVPDVEEDALKAAASPRGTGTANTHITAAAPKEAGRPSRRDALNKRHEGLLKTMQEQSKSRIAMRGGSHARRASISDAAALQALQGMATGARGKGHDGRGRAAGAGVGGRHGGRRASVTLGAPLDSSPLKGSGSDDGSASPGQRSNLIQSLRAAGEQFQRVLGPSSVPLTYDLWKYSSRDDMYANLRMDVRSGMVASGDGVAVGGDYIIPAAQKSWGLLRQQRRRSSLQQLGIVMAKTTRIIHEAEEAGVVLLAALDFVTAVGTRAAAERDAAEAEAAATLDDDGSDLDEDAERPGGNRVRATSAQLAYEWTLLLRAPSGADELPTLCDVSIGWEPPATRPLPAYLAHLTYLPLEHDGMLEERAALLDQHRDAVLTLEAMALYRRCARAATQAAAQFASRNRWVKMNESEKAKVVERHDEAKVELARRRQDEMERLHHPSRATVAERMARCKALADAVMQGFPSFQSRVATVRAWRAFLEAEHEHLLQLKAELLRKAVREAFIWRRDRQVRWQRETDERRLMSRADEWSRAREAHDVAVERENEIMRLDGGDFLPFYKDDSMTPWLLQSLRKQQRTALQLPKRMGAPASAARHLQSVPSAAALTGSASAVAVAAGDVRGVAPPATARMRASLSLSSLRASPAGALLGSARATTTSLAPMAAVLAAAAKTACSGGGPQMPPASGRANASPSSAPLHVSEKFRMLVGMPTYSGYGTGVPDVLRSSLASLPPPTRAAGGREDDGKEASSRAGTPFRSQPVVMPVGMQALSVPALQHEVMAQPAFLTAAKGRNKFNPPPATAGSVRAAMFERGALAVTNMNERVALPPSPTSRWRPDRTSYELSTDHGSESAEWAREWTAESRVASSPAEDGVGKPGVTMPSALRLEDSLQMPSESSTRALAEWRGWAADAAAGSAPATNARTMRTAPAPVHGEARPIQTTSMTPQYAHLAASASTVQGSETLLRGQKQPLTGGGMLGGGLHVQSARMHLTARMAATGDTSSSGSGGVSACVVAEPPCTE